MNIELLNSFLSYFSKLSDPMINAYLEKMILRGIIQAIKLSPGDRFTSEAFLG